MGKFEKRHIRAKYVVKLRPTQRHHGDLEAHARLAKKILLGDFAVFKNEVAGGRGADAEFVFFLAQLQAFCGFGHEERRNALRCMGIDVK